MTIPVSGSAANALISVASADVARTLLDSTVLIEALRRRPASERLRGLRRQHDEPWTCAISIQEIWRGLLPGKRSEHNGWCAACGVHRWEHRKESVRDSGAASLPDEASPSPGRLPDRRRHVEGPYEV
ncbi:PIN domain-containing protein [Mycobacterium heckeshornense]|uniref:PIN domain-containing protein n=1 Tax=Mycobacterium heckeshornense TaxID=110505 RepID=UPI003B8309E5